MTKKFKWLLPIAGLVIIALGFVTMFRPLAGIIALALFFGLGMLVSGISEIASFCGQEKGNRSGMMLASGILSTLLGIWVVFRGGTYAVAAFLPYIFAIWVMAAGITRIADSVSKKSGESVRGWQLVFGILATLSGFALMFNPLFSAAVVSFTMAFTMIAYGFGTIELFFQLRREEKGI